MRNLLKKCIRFYQKYLSLYKLPTCRFYPSCSSYALEALEKYPLITALGKICKRLLRCHPGSRGGVDMV